MTLRVLSPTPTLPREPGWSARRDRVILHLKSIGVSDARIAALLGCKPFAVQERLRRMRGAGRYQRREEAPHG